MTFIVYEPLSSEHESFAESKVVDFVEAESYNYKKHRYGIGTFTLVVPNSVNGLELIKPDMLLLVLDEYVDDSLIITSVKDDGLHTTIKGYDCKLMLKWRSTLFPQEEIEAGTYGYDVVTGTTGQIIKHYIEYNAGTDAEAERVIYGLVCGNMAAGITEDTYMSRMEPLNEVVEALCENADIGYSIDIVREGEYVGYVVTVFSGTDRTNGQSENTKVVFADYTFSASSITAEINTEERKNLIWAINGGTADEATVTAVNNSDAEEQPTGFLRREIVATVNCDPEDVEIYAKKDADSYTDKTEITVEAAIYSDYGKRYLVGDLVTVMKNGIEYNKRVLSAEKNYSGQNKRVMITLGDVPEKRVIERLDYETAKNKSEAVTQRLDGTGGGSGSGTGVFLDADHTSVAHNDVENNTSNLKYDAIEGKNNSSTGTAGYEGCNHVGGKNNDVKSSSCSEVTGYTNTVNYNAYCSYIAGNNSTYNQGIRSSVSVAESCTLTNIASSFVSAYNMTLNNVTNSWVTGTSGTASSIDKCIIIDGNTSNCSRSILFGVNASRVSNSLVLSAYALGNAISGIVVGGQGSVVTHNNCGVFGENHVANHEDTLYCGTGATGNDGTTAYYFAVGNGTRTSPNNIFTVDVFGNVKAAGSYGTTGADYAEYFEWADRNPDNEDRCGLLVSLRGDLIVPAHGVDIIGAVSARASVIGNAYENYWHGKYITDAYGRILTDEDGEKLISPEYEPNRRYIPRSQRSEWAVIGLVGRLIVCDYGKCEAGNFVYAWHGIAVKTTTRTGIRVLRRVDEKRIEVLVK